MTRKQITLDGHEVDLVFLHAQTDQQNGSQDHELYGLAPGQESVYAALADRARARGDVGAANDYARRSTRWAAIADASWRNAVEELAAALREPLDAFVVVPSSRPAREQCLAEAITRSQSDARRIGYRKKAGSPPFKGSQVAEIVANLECDELPDLEAGSLRIGILDDWLGTGRTVRAVIKRIMIDFPEREVNFVIAVGGVSPDFHNTASEMHAHFSAMLEETAAQADSSSTEED